ncbi:MAG: DUF1573 domain-containing protein [bacterium]
MKKGEINVIVGALFLLSCLTPGLSAAAAKTGPKTSVEVSEIKFESRKYDFGKIDQGKIVTHVFKFQNKGKGTLVIDKVKTSCGCTAALLSAKTLKPGENGEIKATFNSGRFRGAIKKTVYVHSNDPREPVVQLRLSGVIKAKKPLNIHDSKSKKKS